MALSLRVNGAPRSVPIGDVVLLDFGGDGRNISTEELTKANAAGAYVVMRNGEQFNASLARPYRQAAPGARFRTDDA